MRIEFLKYQGTGNDFIIIDDRDLKFPKDQIDLITAMCDRKFGIGSDGLILIQPHETLDFNMVFFNPDGSKSLCGNGSRCAVTFARSLEMIGDKTIFETTDGVHDAFIKDDIVHFRLHDVKTVSKHGDGWFINTGSPHYIEFVKDIADVDVVNRGRAIRYSSPFSPAGTNVNFVELKTDQIAVRTYERGVEDETLSCGTGVTACALAAGILGFKQPVTVATSGGILSVSFDQISNHEFKNIYLSGPAEKVFEGYFEHSV